MRKFDFPWQNVDTDRKMLISIKKRQKLKFRLHNFIRDASEISKLSVFFPESP